MRVSICRNKAGLMKAKNIIELSEVLGGIEDSALLRRFLEEILTPAEIEAVALRWELLKRLHNGVPQREISKDLGISLCKITRGSRELKKKDSATLKILQGIDTDTKTRS